MLILAATAKSWRLSRFPSLGVSRLGYDTFWIAVAGIEFALGVWLVLRRGGRRTWAIALTLWLVFFGVAVTETVLGIRSCQCFGTIGVPPRWTVVLDGLCILLLCVARPAKLAADARDRLSRGRASLVCAAAGVGLALIGSHLRPRASTALDGHGFLLAGGTVILEPQKWVGKRFALAKQIDIGPRLGDGDWIVLLIHYDCEHCRRAVPRYAAWSAGDTGRRLALIEVAPYAHPGERLTLGNASTEWGRLSDSGEWFAAVPIVIVLHDGIVRAEASGDEAEDPAWIERKLALAGR